jgi:hypothetical protein
MRLVQYRSEEGLRAVAAVDVDDERAGRARRVDAGTVYELALEAIENGSPLADVVRTRLEADVVDLDRVEAEGRLLPPLDHPVPTRTWVTGTGLTHLGGAQARADMHKKLAADDAQLTDSMKMFKWGIEGGKPTDGRPGVQPEWFFKGNGAVLVSPGQPLPVPEFALDAGEEPEIVGLYVIADDGTPCRLGYALGNEFTDHQMERQNYLYLAHAKLRACSVGPELLLGALPDDVRGASRILRGGQPVWEKPFVTGEANMSHALANLEHHHFKYPMFRRPGDVHLHFFGTSTLSAADGIVPEPGDVFEIDAAPFGRPLRNPLARATWATGPVRAL